MATRTIFHLDMDAFFASVEIVENPRLRGKPVVVGGDPGERSVVSTCSYEARKFGIRSAMPVFEAKQLCPDAIFISGNYSLYRQYSGRVFDILYAMTHKVQPVSIDEAYIDATDLITEATPAKQLGSLLRKRVREETGLTCSLGIASSKLVAKIASSNGKPDGLYEIPAGLEMSFLEPLPITSIPGIGSKTAEILYRDEIHTIGDLQSLPLEQLLYRYGPRGYDFYYSARGIDHREVSWEDHAPKSIGAETTFRQDISELDELKEMLEKMFERAYERLIDQGMLTRTISLKLKDNDFKIITRCHTLSHHTNNKELLLSGALSLLESSFPETPTRLIGICFEKLTDTYWQPSLFSPTPTDFVNSAPSA